MNILYSLAISYTLEMLILMRLILVGKYGGKTMKEDEMQKDTMMNEGMTK